MICAAGLAAVAVLGALALSRRSAAPATAGLCAETKLLPSDGLAGDSFARDYAADVSGDVVVAGSGKHGHRKSGAAYIFRFDGTKWVEEAILRPSSDPHDDHFGRLVAISGDVVVVGAHMDNDRGRDAGAVYVFRYDGIDWIEEAKLRASDGLRGDNFGCVVAIDGPVIAIAAMFTDEYGENSGSGYIFRYDGTNWVEEAKLLDADGSAGARFGRSAGIHGDVAVFGASRDTVDGIKSGAACVFRFDGSKWNQEAKLAPADAREMDWFGRHIDVHGERIIVGANHHTHDDLLESGGAYIFRYDGTKWVQEAELLSSDLAQKDWFGRSVTIHEDMAVVGSHRTYVSGKHSGSVYIFRFDGTTWVEQLKLAPSDGAPWDFFGRMSSLTDDWLVVGANQDDDQGVDSGSAYVYPVSAAKDSCVLVEKGCEGDVNADSSVDELDSGWVVRRIGCSVGSGDPTCDAADANRDMRVDALDLEFVLARFDRPCDTTTVTPVFTGRRRSATK
ncbi:MAG: hypothetical protein IH988_03000 [Planctomycetes bacterium]|nr:hypothetical protein [Planctomycetota bacterium]